MEMIEEEASLFRLLAQLGDLLDQESPHASLFENIPEETMANAREHVQVSLLTHSYFIE